MDLGRLPEPPLTASVDVEFRVNAAPAIETMQNNPEEYGLCARQLGEIPRQLADGEICVSGWSGEKLAFYGWIQFKHRRLARLTKVAIGPGCAFIYRCFTHEQFRGKRLYPAGLSFASRWLADQGYRRAFIDHHLSNRSSERGIRLAGMMPIGCYFVRRWLLLKWATAAPHLFSEISGRQ